MKPTDRMEPKYRTLIQAAIIVITVLLFAAGTDTPPEGDTAAQVAVTD